MTDETQEIQGEGTPAEGQGEGVENILHAPEIKTYIVTRPSSRLHGAIGTGFPVSVERGDGVAGGEVFVWVRFKNVRAESDPTPTQGWFEPCEVEEITEG